MLLLCFDVVVFASLYWLCIINRAPASKDSYLQQGMLHGILSRRHLFVLHILTVDV